MAIVFDTPAKHPTIKEQAETLKRSRQRASAADRRRMVTPPSPKAKTEQRGQGRRRRKPLDSHACLHPSRRIPGVRCLRAVKARSPISKVPACFAHYQSERRTLLKQREASK